MWLRWFHRRRDGLCALSVEVQRVAPVQRHRVQTCRAILVIRPRPEPIANETHNLSLGRQLEMVGVVASYVSRSIMKRSVAPLVSASADQGDLDGSETPQLGSEVSAHILHLKRFHKNTAVSSYS